MPGGRGRKKALFPLIDADPGLTRPMPHQITNPWIFFGAATVFVAYLLSMMFRTRKGERPGHEDREPEL
jgi:hypothetical protein